MSDKSYETESEKGQGQSSAARLGKTAARHSLSIKTLARRVLLSATLMCVLVAAIHILAERSPDIKELVVSPTSESWLKSNLAKEISIYFWTRTSGFAAVWVIIPSNHCVYQFLVSSFVLAAHIGS